MTLTTVEQVDTGWVPVVPNPALDGPPTFAALETTPIYDAVADLGDPIALSRKHREVQDNLRRSVQDDVYAIYDLAVGLAADLIAAGEQGDFRPRKPNGQFAKKEVVR